MYRYREPRTFRTIYMDIGHVAGTIDVLAHAMGLHCLIQHGISQCPIAQLLKIDPLYEGVIHGAALGGQQSSEQSSCLIAQK
jgi:nitroreductase